MTLTSMGDVFASADEPGIPEKTFYDSYDTLIGKLKLFSAKFGLR